MMASEEKLKSMDDEESNKTEQKILETPDERNVRMMSLRILYFVMFLMTLGFSIILTGIYPYLDKVSTR
jgi:ceroid-lipofuscinosis MFS transporter 7